MATPESVTAIVISSIIGAAIVIGAIKWFIQDELMLRAEGQDGCVVGLIKVAGKVLWKVLEYVWYWFLFFLIIGIIYFIVSVIMGKQKIF